jgi:plastocyanin
MAACGGSSTPTSAAAPAATGGATGAPSGSAQVAMQGSAFSPQTVTIPVGGTVTWTNKDSMNHTVTADGGAFQSGDLGNGATFSFTFDTAGTYAYHCTIHPSMTGTVVVQ